MTNPDTAAGRQARQPGTANGAAPAIDRVRRSLLVLTILGALAAVAAGLMTSVAVAEPLAPRAFTEEFVRVLAPKVAAGGITVKGELSRPSGQRRAAN